jgi:hypothetical protein
LGYARLVAGSVSRTAGRSIPPKGGRGRTESSNELDECRRGLLHLSSTARRYESRRVFTTASSLPIRVVLPNEAGILAAARIKAAHPVAFGDAFAIALAQAEQASVITGDNEIRRCAVVQVDWIGS